MASQLRRTGRLYKLLYGDDEGSIQMRRGTITYSYETDRFEVFDEEDKKVHDDDNGRSMEYWLRKNEWIR